MLAGTLVATAGTATTQGAMSAAIEPFDPVAILGMRRSVAEIDRLIETTAKLDLEARARLPGLEAGRADIVVAGACILRAVCKAAGGSEVLVSCGGLRVGLARAIAVENAVDPIHPYE
jgi:exopolyphosphatase/guanosine-5'-triphosphate,3'-diphosphate pyrophosphatase